MLHIAICEDDARLRAQLAARVEAYADARGLAGMNGVETARRMQAGGFAGLFIFITAHRDRALEAFDLGAAHYLVKPVEDGRLAEALDRALHRLGHGDNRGLVVTRGNTRRTVLFRDILYCEVLDHKVFIQLREERLDFYGRLDELAAQLDERFFRCHRSFIVNLGAVHSIDTDSARLAGGAAVPVARRKRQLLADALLVWLQREGN